jgi:hypothetical protein
MSSATILSYPILSYPTPQAVLIHSIRSFIHDEIAVNACVVLPPTTSKHTRGN